MHINDIKSFIILKCFCVLILYVNSFVNGDNPFGLCGDSTCSKPIGQGTVIFNYNSPDDSRLSLQPNEEVDIYVKSYGPKKDLLGVTVRGVKGYISKKFIRENKTYIRDLVPAITEFRTSPLLSSSYPISGHLRDSTHHEPDSMLNTVQESFVNTKIIHQDISSIPSSMQYQSSNPGEDLQASLLSPQFKPSHSEHFGLHSKFEDPSQTFGVPDLDYDLLSSYPRHDLKSDSILPSQSFVPDMKISSSYHGSQMPHSSFLNNKLNNLPDVQAKSSFDNSHSANLNPSSVPPNQVLQSFSDHASNAHPQNFQPHSSMQQQSIETHSSMHSQNFQPHSSMHSQNFQPHSSMQQQSIETHSSMHSQNFQTPPNMPHQNFHPSSNAHQQNFQPPSNVHQQNSHPPPNVHQQYFQPSESVHHKNFQPSESVPHQNFQPSENVHQNFLPSESVYQQNFHPSERVHQQDFQPSKSVHQQNFQPPPNIYQHNFQPSSSIYPHSSLYDYDYDDEYSKTLAMLDSYGLDVKDTNLYGDSPYFDADFHQSSQNIKVEYSSKEFEFGAIPSSSQHPPYQSSDTLFHASNIDPTVAQERNVRNTEVSEKIKGNINVQPNKHLESDNLKAKLFDETNAVQEDLEDIENEESEADIIAEAKNEREGEEEEEEEDEDENVPEKNPPYLESKESIVTTKPHLESSMSLSQMSEAKQDTQSSSVSQSYVADTPILSDIALGKQPTSLKLEETFTSNEPASAHYESDQTKSVDIKQLDAVQLETLATNVENYVDSTREFNSLNSSVHDLDNPADIVDPTVVIKNSQNSDSVNRLETESTFLEKNTFSDLLERNNNGDLQAENNVFNKKTAPQINEIVTENTNSEQSNLLNTLNVDGIEDLKNTYQIRNLKGDSTTEEIPSDSETGHEENNTQSDTDFYSSFENGFNALKSFIDSVMSWIPEPLYSAIMSLHSKGISPRVPVFTVLCGFLCIFLIVPLFYIKEYFSKLSITNQLANVEKDAFDLFETNNVLQEKLGSARSELIALQTTFEEEKNASAAIKSEFDKQAQEIESIKAELETCIEDLSSLKEKEIKYLTELDEHAKEKHYLVEQKDSLEKIITDHENSIEDLNDQLQESEKNVKELENEKIRYMQLKEDYEEKIAQLQTNCNQLLQEAEVWNLRVNELTTKISDEKILKEEMEASSKEKDEEIEALKQVVETFKAFDELEDPEDEKKTKEEKLQTLMKSAMILNQLKKQEEETQFLNEQLEKERNKILDMEVSVSVELLEAKSEIDKLKLSYNRALQDKAEATTKLDVLTNYFKDKEIHLQKQLGAQEAVRQKKEEDASSAERRICLIEQENASYKYQVASMKQEMEETERNLKNQIAAQEKKAHENWIAARAAERKLEDSKQETTQLQQKLTLLEREQENWNSSRDEIIRPVPKRISGVNDEPGNQDMNTSERGMFPPPHLDRLPPPHLDRLPPPPHLDHRLPPPPMMLPPDRPLPPLVPPPMFLPPMERHFRPQPWHLPPDPSSDFRRTPPEFIARRELTPPRGRQYGISDADTGPHASSPLTTDTRDSRNSTPPHLLPDFHDVPPQPGRPFFPPPMGHPRLPMHPPFRRDMGPGPKVLDNPNEYSSRGQQQPPPAPQEQWQHSRV